MAYLDLGADRLAQVVEGNPVGVAHGELPAQQLLGFADDHAALRGQDFGYINRLARGDAQTAALADGVMVDAVVPAYDLAFGGYDFAACVRPRGVLLLEIAVDERGVVAVGHKADFAALRLVGHAQAQLRGQLAHLALAHPAQREQRPRQLLLGQAEEEIRLIARMVNAAQQQAAAGVFVAGGARVVAGGDRLRADALGRFEEAVELDEVVAEGAGDGRAAGNVVVHKRLDHLRFEAVFEIDHVVGNAEVLRGPAGIVNVVERAAAARCAAGGNQIGHALPVPQLHGHADHVCALPPEQSGGGGGIDASAHGRGDELPGHFFLYHSA